MLTDDVGVDGARGNVVHVPQHGAEPCGVQNRARTDHTLLGQAGNLPSGVGQDVDRVRCNEENAVEVLLHDIANDAVQDLNILVDELQAGFTRLLCSTSADDDHGGVGAVVVGADLDVGRAGCPDDAVVEVHDVAGGLLFVDVDNGQFVAHTLVDEGEGVGDSDVASADKNDFVTKAAVFLICHENSSKE